MEEEPEATIQQLNNSIITLYRQGKSQEALPLGVDAYERSKVFYGEQHPGYATSLNNLALLLQDLGKYESAEPLALLATEIWRDALGDAHPEYAKGLNNLGMLYLDMGRNDQAETLLLAAVEVRRAMVDDNHADYAASLNNLAMLYSARGKYEDSEQLYRQVVDLFRTVLGEDHVDYASALNNLAQLQYERGHYAAAEPLYQQASEIWRKAVGENHPDYAMSLNNLAALYRAIGNYATAERLYLKATEIRRSVLGENHRDVGQSLNNLGGLYQAMGKYAAAEPAYQEAREIWGKTVGTRHSLYATVLNNLARLYAARGDYVAAEPLYQEAREIWSTTVGTQHPTYATSLNNLAQLYQATGSYTAAETLYQEANAIRRETLGPDHPRYANGLDNLALFYRLTGNFAVAEPLFQEANDIRRNALGSEHPDYALGLNNLALLYEAMGSHERAEQLLRQANAILHAALGDRHPTYASSLNNLARVYQTSGKYETAEQLYQEARTIWREIVGERHPDYATILNNLAGLYADRGDCVAAEAQYARSSDVWRAAVGEKHPGYAASLNNLAQVYQATGNYAAAEPRLRQACSIWREIAGEDHPDYARSLNNLALLLAAAGRKNEALTLIEQATVIHDRILGQVFSFGSERQRMAYLQTLQASMHGYLSLILGGFTDSPDILRTGLDLILRRKGIAAAALATQRDVVLGNRYPAFQAQLTTIHMLRAQIQHTTLAGPGRDDADTYQHHLATLIDRYEHLETELARQIPEMNIERQLRTIDRRAIAQVLPQGSVLVEFIRVNILDFAAVPARGEARWKSPRYLAFVLPRGRSDNVQMVDLGDARTIDGLIERFRYAIHVDVPTAREHATAPLQVPEHVTIQSSRSSIMNAMLASTTRHLDLQPEAPDHFDEQMIGAALRETIFDPLVPALRDCTQLFLAPDGDLSRVPFEVLPLGDERFLIDAYHISYLSVGRDALRFGVASTLPASPPLVAAAPAFDLGAETAASFLAGVPFAPLKWTMDEGEQVAASLGVQPLLGANVLENVLSAVRSPRILHLATHGFFLPDPQHGAAHDVDRGVMQVGTGNRFAQLAKVDNPLLRSGLALAGANAWLQHQDQMMPADAGDGLLTALDVSGMDLSDTELVVLSACETGLGRVQVGEGVFGLRRAFMLAGAKTLVMSLWKVPDQQTQELMALFYQYVLSGLSRTDALRQAQLALRSTCPSPRFWGGFICQGDPGPLLDSQPS